jgi:hypothetical protein
MKSIRLIIGTGVGIIVGGLFAPACGMPCALSFAAGGGAVGLLGAMAFNYFK